MGRLRLLRGSGTRMIARKGRSMNPTPPPLSRILETSLYVADLDRAEAFYAHVFGFAAMSRDERLRAMAVPGRGVLLLFRRGASGEPAALPFGTIPGHDGGGMLHLAFAIPAGSLAAWEGASGGAGDCGGKPAGMAARGDQPVFPRP